MSVYAFGVAIYECQRRSKLTLRVRRDLGGMADDWLEVCRLGESELTTKGRGTVKKAWLRATCSAWDLICPPRIDTTGSLQGSKMVASPKTGVYRYDVACVVSRE